MSDKIHFDIQPNMYPLSCDKDKCTSLRNKMRTN